MFLDNDYYKFTMQQAVLFNGFSKKKVVYRLVNRGPYLQWRDSILDKVREYAEYSNPTQDDLNYLESRGFNAQYLDALSSFKFNADNVRISNSLDGLVALVEGTWWDTILWEVPLMYSISEAVAETYDSRHKDDEIRRINAEVEILNKFDILVVEFGTRRRMSQFTQFDTIKKMSESKSFGGTSNVAAARHYNLNPCGTIAHEWIMAHGGMFGEHNANISAMRNWLRCNSTYTALTDTYTTEKFIQDIEHVCDMSKISGYRQDSGSPYSWIIKMREAQLTNAPWIFSDSLNATQALAIKNYVGDTNRCLFGIGTSLTNSIKLAPKIAVKLFEIDGQKCRKITDDPAKAVK